MQPPPTVTGPLFIVMNAGSGRQDSEQRQQSIAAAMARAGRQHQLLMFDRKRPITEVARQAVSDARAAGGVVVAAGGDGTINAVVQASMGSGCAVGVLPQGTFNYFGRSHGIPEQTDAALELLLSGQPTPVQVGRVNDRVFIVNASLGLYPQLLQDRENFKQRFGRSRLIAMFAAILSLLGEHRQLVLSVGWRGDRRHVTAESGASGEGSGERTLRTPTLFVGNNRLQLEQIGIEQAEQLEQGRLVAIAPRAVSTATLFGLALRGALGQLGDADSVRSLAFRSMRVEPSRRLGRRRFKLATDGEVVWMRPPFVFDIHPEPMWLIKAVPADAAS